MRVGILFAALALFVFVGGCAVDEDEARRAFLIDAFLDDHRDLLLRDPAEVEGKWARMATTPFQFLRGDIGIWARDAAHPGFDVDHRDAVDDVTVLLVGDPHPENLGTFRRSDGGLVVDWNDFDAARFGPFDIDVRRLAIGFAVVDGVDEDAVARAVARGYVAGSRDEAPFVIEESSDLGPILGKLVRAARDDGEDATPTVALAAHERDDPAVQGVVDDEVTVRLDDDDRTRLLDALSVWRASVDAAHDVAVVDVVRVRGKGVGSRPWLRYRALLNDGRVVELKEARDPFVLEGLVLATSRPFTDNAARVVFARKALSSVDDVDPLLGAAPLPPLGLRVQTESAWQRTLRTRDFAEFSPDDVDAVAFAAGRLLFHAHARAPGPLGEDVAAALRAAVSDVLVDDTAAFVAAYAPVHQSDLVRFRELLREHGPLLGFSP